MRTAFLVLLGLLTPVALRAHADEPAADPAAQVKALIDPEMLIEIEVDAVSPVGR